MGNLAATATRIDAVWRRVNNVFMLTSGGFLMALTFLVGTDVVMRYVFKHPLPSAAELTKIIMPYVVFWAFAYTLREGGHVRVTLVTGRLRPRPRLWTETLVYVIGALFFGLITYYGWRFFWESFVVRENMAASVSYPWYVGKVAMPVGLFFMFIQFLELLLVSWTVPSKVTDAGNVGV